MISGSNEQLHQELEYTLLKPDCHSWWISKIQSDTLEEQYAIKFYLNVEKMPQKRMECFRLLLDHLALIEHQFLSGIRVSRKSESLWGMMRGVGGVRKSIHQIWWAKELGLRLGLLCWGLREFRKRFHRKRLARFKSGQSHFHQVNAPVHNYILVTDYLRKIGIKTVSYPPYSPDLDPCDFWLFPKLRGCRYETLEKMKFTSCDNQAFVGCIPIPSVAVHLNLKS